MLLPPLVLPPDAGGLLLKRCRRLVVGLGVSKAHVRVQFTEAGDQAEGGSGLTAEKKILKLRTNDIVPILLHVFKSGQASHGTCIYVLTVVNQDALRNGNSSPFFSWVSRPTSLTNNTI